MNVEIYSLCDAATSDGGKLNMLGAFDTIWIKKFPAVHPHCAIALRIRFDRKERGTHNVKINALDPNGANVVPPLEGKVNVKTVDQISSSSINLILNIQQLKLTNEGEYSFELDIDGKKISSLPLFVQVRVMSS